MRKKILIFFFLILFLIAYPEDKMISDKPVEDKEVSLRQLRFLYSSGISLGIFSYLNFGIGKIVDNEKYTKEKLLVFHGGSMTKYFLKEVYTIGIYRQTKYFKNRERKGFYFKTDLGIDYFYAHSWSDPFSGLDKGPKNYILPNVVFGGGYSFIIGENTYIRISIDAGIKAVISNLNLSVTF